MMYGQTDSGNKVVRRIAIASTVVSTMAGAVGVSGYADGQGTVAKFSGAMSGIAMNPEGSVVYIVSYPAIVM